MISHPTKPTEADADAVERDYAELAADYAEQRSQVAETLGRQEAAREWRDIGEEIQQEDKHQAAES